MPDFTRPSDYDSYDVYIESHISNLSVDSNDSFCQPKLAQVLTDATQFDSIDGRDAMPPTQPALIAPLPGPEPLGCWLYDTNGPDGTLYAPTLTYPSNGEGAILRRRVLLHPTDNGGLGIIAADLFDPATNNAVSWSNLSSEDRAQVAEGATAVEDEVLNHWTRWKANSGVAEAVTDPTTRCAIFVAEEMRNARAGGDQTSWYIGASGSTPQMSPHTEGWPYTVPDDASRVIGYETRTGRSGYAYQEMPPEEGREVLYVGLNYAGQES